jgi:ketosteroid isomerase-like protein
MSESVSLVRAGFEAIAKGGVDELLERFDELFAEDFEWRPALSASTDGRTYTGKAGFTSYWNEFAETFPDFRFGEPSFEDLNEARVLVIVSITGTGASSGIPIDRTVAYVFETDDERIRAGRTFFSPTEAREYLANA